jgi:rhamnose transport system ATP-binding protein
LQSGGSERRRLSVDGLSRAGAFEDVSFDVSQGEIVGLCGVLGSGTESVLRTLAGLERPSAGRVTLDGEPWSCADPHAAVARGIGYIPAERGREGLVLPLSVAHNLTLPRLDLVSWLGVVRPARERSLTRHWSSSSAFCSAPNVAASSLSGNQQRSCWREWLAANVKLSSSTISPQHRRRCERTSTAFLRADPAAGHRAGSDTLEEAIGLRATDWCVCEMRVTASGCHARKPF